MTAAGRMRYNTKEVENMQTIYDARLLLVDDTPGVAGFAV